MPVAYHCTTTRVHIEGLSVEAFVGWGGPERTEAQTILIDITAELDPGQIDDRALATTVDYVPIVSTVRVLALRKTRRLIETFAEEIAGECFKNAHVKEATVTVRKPNKLDDCVSVGTTRTFIRKGKS